MEGDNSAGFAVYEDIVFLPTPSHGGRRLLQTMILWGYGFLPTPSHGGRLIPSPIACADVNFYPRPHMEGDRFRLPSD